MSLSAYEFYSGIGGLHKALLNSRANGGVDCAYDWDRNAVRVYKENHTSTTVQQIDISTLTPESLSRVDLWLLSPACQPYTVLNPDAKGAQDPRAKSFLHLIQTVLPELVQRRANPSCMLIENVAGFEGSTTRQTLLSTFRSLNYSVAEFLLTPLQFGIPNSRLRYYCLARQLDPPLSEHLSDHILRSIPGRGQDWADPRFQVVEDALTSDFDIRPLRNYLEAESVFNEEKHPHAIPDKVLLKWGRLFDIVKPSAQRSCCFTRGYTQLVERAGSILQMNESLDTTESFDKFLQAQSNEAPDALRFIRPLRLRYFTPTELLRIFGFVPLSNRNITHPDEFKWPSDISNKSKYRLIGNSVNVYVVTELINYLFEV